MIFPNFQTNEVLSAHVEDDCGVCEARAARMCDACDSGDPVFAFQASSTIIAHDGEERRWCWNDWMNLVCSVAHLGTAAAAAAAAATCYIRVRSRPPSSYLCSFST